jgi:hypothetical protein
MFKTEADLFGDLEDLGIQSAHVAEGLRGGVFDEQALPLRPLEPLQCDPELLVPSNELPATQGIAFQPARHVDHRLFSSPANDGPVIPDVAVEDCDVTGFERRKPGQAHDDVFFGAQKHGLPQVEGGHVHIAMHAHHAQGSSQVHQGLGSVFIGQGPDDDGRV